MGRRRNLEAFIDGKKDESEREAQIAKNKADAAAASETTVSAPEQEETELEPVKGSVAAAAKLLGFEPQIERDFTLPPRTRSGKWVDLAKLLNTGEAVTNLPTKQAATALKQALKAQGKNSEMGRTAEGLYAVKVAEE